MLSFGACVVPLCSLILPANTKIKAFPANLHDADNAHIHFERAQMTAHFGQEKGKRSNSQTIHADFNVDRRHASKS